MKWVQYLSLKGYQDKSCGFCKLKRKKFPYTVVLFKNVKHTGKNMKPLPENMFEVT